MPSSVLSYHSTQKSAENLIFYTVKNDASGVIVGIKQAHKAHANAIFETFSGDKNPRTNLRLTSTQTNGQLPKGTWYISKVKKWGNTVTRIAQKLNDKSFLKLPKSNSRLEFRKRQYWFALYRDDRDIGDIINDYTVINGITRGGFRLHYGSISYGCMTFKNIPEFKQFVDIIKKVTPMYIDDHGRRVGKSHKEAIEVYGKLIVD